jgi:biotin transport system substrate-specific component
MTLKHMVCVSLFTALTIVLSLITIPLPFTPVPVTGQTIAVILSGALLGSRLGPLSQVLYMLIGIVGIPVFSGGRGGPGIIIGPTGGFIWGFILTSYVIGKITEVGYTKLQKHSTIVLISAFLIGGIGILYTVGVTQLAIVLQLTIPEAIVVGFLPFIPGDLFKIVIASTIGIRLMPVSRKQLGVDKPTHQSTRYS